MVCDVSKLHIGYISVADQLSVFARKERLKIKKISLDKVIQVIDVDFILFLSPRLVAGPQKPQTLTASKPK